VSCEKDSVVRATIVCPKREGGDPRESDPYPKQKKKKKKKKEGTNESQATWTGGGGHRRNRHLELQERPRRAKVKNGPQSAPSEILAEK